MKELQGKKILITGGAGFIGSHLTDKLLLEGAQVICVDNLCQGKLSNLENAHKSHTFVFEKCDCNSYAELEQVFSKHKPDYVFHYAAVVGVIRTIQNPLLVFTDLDGLKNVFELSRLHNVKKLVYSSSSEVYGEPVELPEREESPLNARTPYSIIKSLGEQYCKVYWEQYKLPTVALRFFNVYGPRQESTNLGFVVGIFCRNVMENKPPVVMGDGSMTRDFVYVEDNINAALKSLFVEELNGQAVNIGNGGKTTVLELAEKVIEVSGKKLKPEFGPFRDKTEIIHRYPDVTKMHTVLGYKCKVPLEVGLKATLESYY